MKLHASGEDYLEAMLILQRQMEESAVRSIDLARHMEFSKPSISHAVGALRDGGFLVMDRDGFLHLTEKGREIAEKIYERHRFLQNSLSLPVWTKQLQSRMPAGLNTPSAMNPFRN